MQTSAEFLSQGGPLVDLVADFFPRQQQIELAETIEQALAEGNSLVCEAGTGTGKTFAYLVPALLSGKKVIISTGTKHLQDQLFLKDLPLVHEATRLALNVSLLKGRANYLCLHALKMAQSENRYLKKESLSQLADIQQWATHTPHGDMDELSHIPDDASVRSMVTSTTDNCLGQECDFYDECHLFRARKKAGDADLLVVNHHLFFADLSLREQGYGELLPTADAVIFDEAHQLPDLASAFFSQTLSSRQLLELASDSKAGYFEEAADIPEFLTILEKFEKSVRDMRLAFGTADIRMAWKEAWGKKALQEEFDTLMERGHDLHTALETFSARGKILDNCCKRTADFLNLLDSFSGSETPEQIRWLETRGRGFLLHQTPLDIADVFQARLAEYDCQCIYTSATLSVNKSFKHFSMLLGLDGVRCQSWESPFDFRKQALLYLPENLPDPRQDGYTEQVVEKAIPVLELTQGHAFFLFTSHRALRIAAACLADRISFPLLVQGDAPRTELLDTFRNTRHAVLLGTSSFWEGVDVRGQSLSCVIIDKLPFAAPGDPVYKARMQLMEEQGRNPFIEHQVPEAVISLKQGIGRLIRDRDDYGLLMLCDPRLKTKGYGRTFLRSLPDMQHSTDLGLIEEFFQGFET